MINNYILFNRWEMSNAFQFDYSLTGRFGTNAALKGVLSYIISIIHYNLLLYLLLFIIHYYFISLFMKIPVQYPDS